MKRDGIVRPCERYETVTLRKNVTRYKNMRKWMVECLRKFENRGIKIPIKSFESSFARLSNCRSDFWKCFQLEFCFQRNTFFWGIWKHLFKKIILKKITSTILLKIVFKHTGDRKFTVSWKLWKLFGFKSAPFFHITCS